MSMYDDYDEDDYIDEEEEESENWDLIKSKEVTDADGFTTEYSMYESNLTDEYRAEYDIPKYICMFGDRDTYPPDAMYADWSGDTEQEAEEWFNDYHGFEEEFENGTAKDKGLGR